MTPAEGRILVVDASVAAKWFLDEELGDAALDILSLENRLHAPEYVLIELGSVLVKRVRRGEITRDDADTVRRAMNEFPVDLHANGPLLGPAYEIAVETGTSIYDSLYLALAMSLDTVVVTADRKHVARLIRTPFERFVRSIGEW